MEWLTREELDALERHVATVLRDSGGAVRVVDLEEAQRIATLTLRLIQEVKELRREREREEQRLKRIGERFGAD